MISIFSILSTASMIFSTVLATSKCSLSCCSPDSFPDEDGGELEGHGLGPDSLLVCSSRLFYNK